MKKLFLLLLILLIACPTYADQWNKAVPCKTGVNDCASADDKADFPADQQANNISIDRLLANYREGMTITYSSASAVSVSAGEVMVSNAAGTVRFMMQNTAATSVTFSNIDTGSEASSTTYYVYATAATTADTEATFKISASSTAPTGSTYYKRIGSFYNNASGDVGAISNDNSNSQFGAAQARTANVVYQAQTDGHVFGSCTYSGSGYFGCQIYSDSAAAPSTLLNQCYANFYGTYVSSCPVFATVKKGDYWVAYTSNSYYGQLYFRPVGN